MADIPITPGSGGSSVATELVGARNFQLIEVYGQGGASVLGINPDGSLRASVQGTVTISGNPSVSGTVGASVIGIVPVQLSNSSVITVSQNSSIIAVPTGNQSVSGTVGASVVGWVPIQPSNTSVIGVIQGSVATVIIGGSIAASFTPPANQSVSGTVQTDVRGSVAVAIISGSIAATFTPPANQSVSGTVQTDVRGSVAVAIISGSIAATFTPPANQSVSGTIGASIIGQLPAGTAPIGSVAVLQGTNPWIETFSNSSILAVPVGSVITVWKDSSVLSVPVGSTIAVLQAASIVGTYAEDAASSSSDKGLFFLGARNDTLSSVTNADLDYSGIAIGPVGEVITENAPITKWVSGTADFRQGNTGASIIAIASGGSSIFTYITGIQVANMGSASVLVTLASGGSTLGYTIAPAGGGSNIYYQNALKTPGNFGFAASLSGIASVLLSAQGFISKT